MPLVSLINKSKTLKTYNLPHAEYCAGGMCLCTPSTLDLQEALADGTRGIRQVVRLVSASLMLPVGAQSAPMQQTLANVRDIKRDLDSGALRLVEHPDRPAVTEVVEPSLPATTTSSEPSSPLAEPERSRAPSAPPEKSRRT